MMSSEMDPRSLMGAFRRIPWRSFFLGAGTGCLLTLGLLWCHIQGTCPQDDPPGRGDLPDGQPDPPDGQAEEGTALRGQVVLRLEADGREVACRAAAAGRRVERDSLRIAEAELDTDTLDCGSADLTAWLREEVVRSDYHPKASFVVLVGDVDRKKALVVDQIFLQGERRTARAASAREEEDGSLHAELQFDREYLGLWSEETAGRRVGGTLSLVADLAPETEAKEEPHE
ncbi:MAG: hypothetical protein KDD47_25685 [Acidobacteria bacterium]|nr:hypothetical protein [Acidobacteriota bacterium]